MQTDFQVFSTRQISEKLEKKIIVKTPSHPEHVVYSDGRLGCDGLFYDQSIIIANILRR